MHDLNPRAMSAKVKGFRLAQSWVQDFTSLSMDSPYQKRFACRLGTESGGSMPSFTAKQGQYLAFIYAYTRVLGRPPAEADLQRHFGVSPPSVHQMVLTLERARLIRRKPGIARSIEVVIAPELLPVLYCPRAPWRPPDAVADAT